MKIRIFPLLIFTLFALFNCENKSDNIRISAKQVQDGEYTAEVHTVTHVTSDYPMNLDHSIAQPILFKLSLNGRDNEGQFGKDHYLIVPEGVTEFNAPTLKFGQRAPKLKGEAPKLSTATNVHFRVDLRPVLRDFQKQAYHITQTADTIFANTFDGLYLAGGVSPLRWIWDDPAAPEQFRFDDSDQDSIYELSVHFDPASGKNGERSWELAKDLSAFPKFSSPQAPLLEALTNLALEEALLNVRDDQAFSAGKEWPGVWTRDFSYAGQLSLAYLFPESVQASLRAKLKADGRIIQDTGTGGSWPISSDRHVWTLAAWELFLATGDKSWLDEIREPVIKALKEDILWNRDPISGMLQGETSFEDWREQTYPVWMTPADIHASHGLSTNILFKRALEIGLVLAKDQQDVIQFWPQLITRLDQNILNHFWSESLGAPASYVMASPAWLPSSHRDLLGESLGILFCNSFSPIAGNLVASYPRTAYGSPVISHQLPHSPPYHNQAIWPFVEAYSLLAAKEAGQQAAYRHSFNGLIRAAAVFLTNRENYHYTTGRPDQTEINSDRQLWSVAAWLSAIYKGLFGIAVDYNFDQDNFELRLNPNNPFQWKKYSLTNLTLHNTPINIVLNGSGSVIRSIRVNGKVHEPDSPLPLLGEALNIRIELKEAQDSRTSEVNLVEHVLPEIPTIHWSADTLKWNSNTSTSILELNGRVLDTLRQSPYVVADSLSGFLSLRTLDSSGATSLPTQPHYQGLAAALALNSKDPYYIELGNKNSLIEVSFSLPTTGNYLLRFVYSNGSGPINTGNTCGLAKLKINDWWLEKMISFPHTESWEQWSTTAWTTAQFEAGLNTLELDQESLPLTNMNGTLNQFRVQGVEIIPMQN